MRVNFIIFPVGAYHSFSLKTYANASILKNGRIVFNIKGNSFRLVAKFNFEKQWVFIRFIGTHTEYDKIDVNTIYKKDI